MNLKKVKQDTLRFLGNYFLFHSINVLCKSLKIKKQNYETIIKLDSEKQNYLLAFWHGTMLLPWYLHRSPNSARTADRFAALTSQSKDGDLLAKILKKWNYEVVRGSSSKGGDVALSIIVDYARNNFSIAITPDGPRGPRHQFKAGAVVAAKRSGIPVVLAGVGFKKKKILKNWDRFEIPHFFTRANIIYSKPILVNENLSYDEISALIKHCNDKLNELQEIAQQLIDD
jgi:lysophospholipid acyltransferase (LPLAT)-like uncharacterized protein